MYLDISGRYTSRYKCTHIHYYNIVVTIRIGTSGWVYKHWRGDRPALKQREWFGCYAREFDTVEINNSFYRLPSETAFDAWREQAPPGFVYAVKASRFLTHMKKLKEPEQPLALFFSRASRLRGTLGPVLYQLPPRWKVNLERFEHFLSVLPSGYSHVVEFRDPTWLIADVFRLMERHAVAHCMHDMGGAWTPLRVTARKVYVRFHGDLRHGGNYTDDSLREWAQRIAGWRGQHDVFVYFNNDVGGYALDNARTVKRFVIP